MSAFQHFRLVAAYAWVLLIAGCSPSPDAAKLVLQQRIASESQGHIKLVRFKKLEVQELQGSGVQECRIRYEAEVEFDRDGVWSRGAPDGLLSFRFRPYQRMAEGGVANMIGELRGDRKIFQGDDIKIVGVMTGTKSESGWRYELKENHLAD